MEFTEFPKIGRLSRDIVITEKIDGTNGQIAIGDDGSFFVGSRTRWLTAETGDNHGFLLWAMTHRDELIAGLGPGRHFGEWWGSGIQRGYGLQKGEKRFSLFNVSRWHAVGTEPTATFSNDPRLPPTFSTVAPSCCGVVPVVYRGPFATEAIYDTLGWLESVGSQAAPGFMKPEGIVVFHAQSNTLFKKTIERDEEPKSRQKESASVTLESVSDKCGTAVGGDRNV